MKKLAMFVVLSMLCCFYAATSLAAQTNYWKFHIVADERVDGNSEPVPKNDSEQICHVTKKSLAVDVGIRKTYFNMPREVYASRGISIIAINTCGDCQMKGSVRYEQR